MSDNLTVPLPAPITIKEKTVSELVLVRPRIGWRIEAEQFLRNGAHPEATSNYSVRLIAKCAGVPDAFIRELEAPEFYAAWDWIAERLEPPSAVAEPAEGA